MRTTLILLTALAAAGAPAGPARAADDRAKTLAPFLDEQTLVVGRIDVTRIDPKAIFAKVRQFAAKVEPDPGARKGLERGFAHAEEFTAAQLGRFTQAGGRDMYVVVSLADLPPEPLFVVVPLGPKADAKAIIRWLRGEGPTTATRPAATAPTARAGKRGPLPFGVEVLEEIHGAVVAGRKQTLDRLRRMKPAPRPEVAKAFAAIGSAAVEVLILPTADSRRVIEEMMPTLPEEVGGGPSTAVTRGFLWAAMALDGPPKMSLRVVVQSKDAASAKAFHGVFRRSFAALAGHTRAQQVLPEIKGILTALTPAVEGDHLVLTLDAERMDALIGQFVPSIVRARLLARRAVAATNLSAILKALHMYAADHKGRFPDDLSALVKAKLVSVRMLINPSDPARKSGYVYVRPAGPLNKIANAAETLVIYEAHEAWGEGINVGFVDGHVAFMRDAAEFKKLLAASKGAAAAKTK